MFEYLKGGLSSATAADFTPVGKRVSQGFTLVILVIPFAATIFGVIQLIQGDVSAKDLALLGSFYVASSMGVTIGFHRMLAHGSFEAHPVLKFILLVFGTWSIQGAALSWAAIHIKHHATSDTPDDPHTPTRSFVYAHMGWLLGMSRADPKTYAKAQMRDPIVMLVSRFAFWFATLGLLIPLFAGGWSGFLWGGLIRVFLVHHVTWSVNSVCHVFGRRPYRVGQDRSTNNWIVGLLAMGEGWHNNHHAFPKSASHGLTGRQIDFSAYVIRALSWVGLVSDVHRPSDDQVVARREDAGERIAA